MTSKKPPVVRKPLPPRKPLRTFAVHILAGDVRRVIVRARDEVHASRLAEAEYNRCAGEPGEFFECDHEEVACYEVKKGQV